MIFQNDHNPTNTIPEMPKRARTHYSFEFALAYEIYTNVKCVLAEPGARFRSPPFLLRPENTTPSFYLVGPESQAFISQVTRARLPIDKRPFHSAR